MIIEGDKITSVLTGKVYELKAIKDLDGSFRIGGWTEHGLYERE